MYNSKLCRKCIMKIGGSVAFLFVHEKSCKQRMNVRRPNVFGSGSSGDGRSIYQERAGRVGGWLLHSATLSRRSRFCSIVTPPWTTLLARTDPPLPRQCPGFSDYHLTAALCYLMEPSLEWQVESETIVTNRIWNPVPEQVWKMVIVTAVRWIRNFCSTSFCYFLI